jgi:predicted nucleotidyltransferase component of viral defense system
MKGGTALDTIYKITKRQSIDIDYSMEGDPFLNFDLTSLKNKIEKLFISEFKKNDFFIFDFNLTKRPLQPSQNRPLNWYGYKINFKLMPKADKTESLENNRKIALSLGKKEKKEFEIDISPFEFTEFKVKQRIDDYNVYIYSPEMILIEKLRSICQQMDEYKSTYQLEKGKGRAKDFYDISLLINQKLVSLSEENKETFTLMVQGIFNAKDVSVKLLNRLPDYKNLHESDFPSVKATVPPRENIQNFDYYFENVLSFIQSLKEFGII